MTTERRLFTVSDYYRMGEAGIFHPEERVELLGGEIFVEPRMTARHAATNSQIMHLLVEQFAGRFDVSIRNPVRLSQMSEPVPDAALVRPFRLREAPTHPTPADVYLLIEVIDNTLAYDRDLKIPFYAAAEIPEVWMIDVNRLTITQYVMPREGEFTRYTVWRSGDLIPCNLGVEIAVDDVVIL